MFVGCLRLAVSFASFSIVFERYITIRRVSLERFPKAFFLTVKYMLASLAGCKVPVGIQ